MALREIAAHFGFTFDAAKLGQIDKGVSGVKEKAKGATSTVAELAGGLKAALVGVTAGAAALFLGHVANEADAINDLSDQLGIGTQALQSYGYGAKLAGAELSDFYGGLRKLNIALAGGKEGDGTGEALFKRLKIETRDASNNIKSLEALLPEIADRFKDIASPTERAALASQIFGKSGAKLAPLLARGSEGIAELRKEFDALGGGFSPEAIKQAGEYNDQLDKLNFAFFGLKSLLATSVFPLLSDTMGVVVKGVVQFRSWLKETTALSTAVKLLAFIVGRSLLLALAPFILPGLKFLAIFLAVDDLIGFLEGKDSQIGHILEEWFGEDTTNDIRSALNSIKDIVAGVLAGIKFLFGQSTDETTAEFLRGTAAMSAAIDNWFLYFAEVIGKVHSSFIGTIAMMIAAWNDFIAKTVDNLPPILKKVLIEENVKKKLQIDGSGVANEMAIATAAMANIRANIEDNKDKLANGGNAINAQVGYGPVKAPTAQTNYVEINAPVQVTLPPGVNGTQARELTRQAVIGQQQAQMRNALQSLEQR